MMNQPGLFEGPPAGPVANPAPRPEVPEVPPPPPALSFSAIHREWEPRYGDILQVDIRASETSHTWEAGRLVRGVPGTDHDGPDKWICEPHPDEEPGFLPDHLLDREPGWRRLRDAKRDLVAWVRIWANPEA